MPQLAQPLQLVDRQHQRPRRVGYALAPTHLKPPPPWLLRHPLRHLDFWRRFIFSFYSMVLGLVLVLVSYTNPNRVPIRFSFCFPAFSCAFPSRCDSVDLEFV